MRKFKSVALHIIAFVCTVVSLWLLLVLSSSIPNNLIKNTIEKSALTYKNKEAFSSENGDKLNAVADNYADSILLNVTWNMGEGNPFISSLDTKYNDGGEYGENAGLYLSVTEGAKPNTDYTRYWHGSAMLLRPFHLVFSVDGIKLIGLIAALLLALLCILMLLQRKHYDLAISLALSLAAVHIWNIRLSLEYQPCFIICLIMCLLFLYFERKSTVFLTYLSVIGGTLVAFFDFLTTETMVILLPLILTFTVRAKENRLGDFKSNIKLLIKCGLCFLLAYGGTFIAKWAIASLVTGENKFILAFASAEERVGGSLASEGVNNPIMQIILSPIANLTVLFGGISRIDIARVFIGLLLSVMVLGSVLYLFKKKTDNRTVLRLLAILGLVVFARYLVMSNHSYLHEFFTYRALVSPIMAIFSGIALSCAPSEKGAKK